MNSTLKLFGWMIIGGSACLGYAGCVAPVDSGADDAPVIEDVGTAASAVVGFAAFGPCEWHTTVVGPNDHGGVITQTSCRNKTNEKCAEPDRTCRGYLKVSSPNSTTVTAVCDCQPKDPI